MKRDMAWEWNWPRFHGGSTLTLWYFSGWVNWGGDHAPGFGVSLCILNITLLDFGYYNSYHADEQEQP